MSAMATTAEQADQPAEVANKVLRRAQVSKMTRALQNRLALANVKIKNGWGNLPLESLEPKIEQELKRKRPGSSNGALSDTSSSVSERFFQNGGIDSSPLTAPLFSDDRGALSGSSRSSKRTKQKMLPPRTNSLNNRPKTRPAHNKSSSWKQNYRLPQSSPGYRHNRSNTMHNPSLSYISEATVPDEIASPHSEEDDSDLPTLSFQVSNNRQIRSSPPRIPRTPSPNLARSARLQARPFNATGAAGRSFGHGEDAADLLMFLTASPSPAVGNKTSRGANPPSTPPSKSTPLPSSMMSTPGGGNTGFIGFGAATPGPLGFNFADYLNVTPSPAPAAWAARTPGKTPSAAAAARVDARGSTRRLHFDGLQGITPQLGGTGSPSAADLGRPGERKVAGLGMELGGELVSSQ